MYIYIYLSIYIYIHIEVYIQAYFERALAGIYWVEITSEKYAQEVAGIFNMGFGAYCDIVTYGRKQSKNIGNPWCRPV